MALLRRTEPNDSVDLAGRILHWFSRIVFPACFLPFLFPYTVIAFIGMAFAGVIVYLGERRTAGLPLTQSRSFHVMRLCGIAAAVNASLFFGLFFYSQTCILRPMSQELEPLRDYYRRQGQFTPETKP